MTNTANYLYNVVNRAASLALQHARVVYGMDYVDKEGNKIPVQSGSRNWLLTSFGVVV